MRKPEPDHPEAYTSSFDTFYSYFAGIYDFLVKHTSLWEAWEGPIIPLIRGSQVLEVSFGPGWLINRYPRRFETYGIDLNMRLIQITPRNLRAAGISIPLQRANVEALPYRSDTFDTVVNPMAFSGYPRADNAMSEFRRVLKLGGRLLLINMGLPQDGNWIGRGLVRLYEATGDIARDMTPIFRDMGSCSVTRQLMDLASYTSISHRRIRSRDISTMALLQNPFFWAFVSMFALMGATSIACVHKLSRHPRYGIIVVAIFALGRVVLVLPFLPQPRFELGGWHWVVDGFLFALGAIFAVPAFSIKPFTAPDEKIKLKMDGSTASSGIQFTLAKSFGVWAGRLCFAPLC